MEIITTWRSIGIKSIALLVAPLLVSACGPSSPEEFAAAARQELERGDRTAAVIQLRNALQKNPDFGEARFLLGKALLDSGDGFGAEKELRKALQLQYVPDLTVPALARAMLMIGQSDKVLEEFATFETGTPDATADLQTSLGYARLYQGKNEDAQAAFAAALAAKPNFTSALLGEARIKSGARDFKAALDLVDKALATAPNVSEAWEVRGGVLIALGQLDDALAAYRKAIETDPKNVTSHVAVVTMLMRDGKTDEARKALDALKKAAPRHSQTLYLEAWIAYSQKNYQAASEAIQQQLKSAPDNVPGLLLGGAIDLQLKSYNQAETKLAKVLGRAPGNRLATRLLISTYVESGQSTKAMATLKPVLRAIEKDPDMLALAGAVFMQNGDVEDGVAYFEKAVALDPEHSGKRTAVALAHLRSGSVERGLDELEQVAETDTGTSADMALIATYLRNKQTDKALAAIDALEKKKPASPVPANLRGGALLAKGDTAGARKAFERALELDPGYFPAAANLARLDIADKKPGQAKKRFEAVLAKDPKNARAYLALAQLRAGERGTAEEVGALIAKGVAANPTDETARLALIEHYIRNKDATRAVNAAQEALAALPNRPQLLDALGRAHRAAGDNNQALATYRRLAEQVPASPLPYYRMAEIQVAMKDKDKALESAQQALALKADFVEAQRLVIALDLDAGRLQQAVAMARQIQKQRPKQSVGYVFEGDIYASKKAWKEALAAYRAGLKATGTPDLAMKVDTSLRRSGEQAEAEKFSAAWLKEHPKDQSYRVYLGEAALAAKNYAAAIEHYSALVEARPNDGLMLNNLAWAMAQMKDPRAFATAEKAYQLAPDSANVMDTLGVMLVEKGETARGIELLRKASERAPKSASIRLNLAKALIKAGEKDAARKELEVLEKLGDKYPQKAEVAQLMKGL